MAIATVNKVIIIPHAWSKSYLISVYNTSQTIPQTIVDDHFRSENELTVDKSEILGWVVEKESLIYIEEVYLVTKWNLVSDV